MSKTSKKPKSDKTKVSYYPSVSIADPKFKRKLVKRFRADGLAVITDVFSSKQCKKYMDRIVDHFVNLGTGIDPANIADTWTVHNLPPQTRHGLFQALTSNFDTVWDIRSSPSVRKIFRTVYSDLRAKPVDDFIVSGDGINVRPGFIGPFTKPSTRDWAHVDQTVRDDIFKCVQGQAVLTNTTAAFRATPKSHLAYDRILTKLGIDSKSNWLKFSPTDLLTVQKIVGKYTDKWQIPIYAPKGSFIIWASTTIHSAKLQDHIEKPLKSDPYNGWRGVVYVCYRPTEEFTNGQIKKRINAFESNRTTNHWGTKIFSKRPGIRFLYAEKRHPLIERMLDDPTYVYKKIGKPELGVEHEYLLGL